MSGRKSYRNVSTLCADRARGPEQPRRLQAVAELLCEDWGYGYRVGHAGVWRGIHVWQCLARDGSRFLLCSTDAGEAFQLAEDVEIEASRALDVETHVDRSDLERVR